MRRRQGKRAEWQKELAAVLMFVLLFPYFLFSFQEQKKELLGEKETVPEKGILEKYIQLSELPHNNVYYVAWEEEGVTLRLPVEHFLVGALASSISTEYEKETLAAQAVLLRSSLVKAYAEEEMKNGVKELAADDGLYSYWSDARMRTRWGKQYEQSLDKCLDAVIETQGIYLTWNGEAIKGYYHGMSAGGTRNGKELSDGESYGYLKKADCPENLSASDYLTEYRVSIKQLGELTEAEQNTEGYVLSVCKNGIRISGEKLREELGLSSTNFTWKEEDGDYIFSIRGRGHGFGLDQYYANVLAQNGMTYWEIVDYFFADTDYQRME